MADTKITGLTELAAAPDDADLLAIVDDPAGTPATKKITAANLLANVSRVIDTASPSAASEVDFSLPSGYSGFTLRGWIAPANDGVAAILRCNDGGGFDNTDEYWNAEAVSDSNGNYGDEGDSAGAAIALHRTTNLIGNGTGEGVSFTTEIERAKAADFTFFHTRTAAALDLAAGGGLQRGQAAGLHAVAAALTQIRVMFSAGNIAAGELRLIGIP